MVGHDVADTALVFDPGRDQRLVRHHERPGPAARRQPTPVRRRIRSIGRFITPDRADLFMYYPGTKAEHIYHPIF